MNEIGEHRKRPYGDSLKHVCSRFIEEISLPNTRAGSRGPHSRHRRNNGRRKEYPNDALPPLGAV